MEVTYKFSLDQRVVTPFGEAGIIAMLGYDDGGNQYFVKTATGGTWFKENQLSA